MKMLSDKMTASFNLGQDTRTRGDLTKDFSVYEKKAGTGTMFN